MSSKRREQRQAFVPRSFTSGAVAARQEKLDQIEPLQLPVRIEGVSRDN
jgi:hypothetical protein